MIESASRSKAIVSHRSSSAAVTRGTANLKILRKFAHETLEGELSDEKFSRLLVATDLAQRHCSGAEAMRLLHTTRSSLQSISLS